MKASSPKSISALTSRQRTTQSLDRLQSSRPTHDRVLILAPEGSLPYLKDLVFHLQLSEQILLVENPDSLPDQSLILARSHQQQSGPFRRVFFLLDLPPGPESVKRQQAMKLELQDHGLLPNMQVRAFYSMPGFPLWLWLHFEESSSSLHVDPPQVWLGALWQKVDLFLSQPLSPFLATRDLLPRAMERSRALALARLRNPEALELPFTEIHELWLHLLRLQQCRQRLIP